MPLNHKNKRPDFPFKVERVIFKSAVAGMLILVVFQAVMLNRTARVFLNYATRLEGGALEEAGLLAPAGKVVVKIENQELFPNAILLVNGEPVASFGSRQVEIEVKNNDLIEVDASRIKDEFVHVSVAGISDNVIRPGIGMRVKVKNKIQVISRVKLK